MSAFQAAGWALSWLCYGLGHLVSSPMHWRPTPVMARLCPVYNTLMCWSASLQDWAKVRGPWHGAEE